MENRRLSAPAPFGRGGKSHFLFGFRRALAFSPLFAGGGQRCDESRLAKSDWALVGEDICCALLSFSLGE